MGRVKRALLSVSDKTGLIPFAQGLRRLGVELVSSGGTARELANAGISHRTVEDVTGSPEILDGRVKTLHPKIHGGILANREIPAHLKELENHGIGTIDLVVVNLYPFQEVTARPGIDLATAIENIDIGGSALIRAAAKNHQSVAVVVSPRQYDRVLAELEQTGEISLATRQKLAVEGFLHSASYDTAIYAFLAKAYGFEEQFSEQMILGMSKVQDLRYGENPGQKAAFYRLNSEVSGLSAAVQLQGKELSYNNYLDLDAALGLAQEFSEPAAVVIKHTNPCGAALGKTIKEAYVLAREADPLSAFGSVVACNREIDGETASEIAKTFVEAVIAPEFSPEAREILQQKENLRLLALQDFAPKSRIELRSVQGGILMQENDYGVVLPKDWQIVSGGPLTFEDEAELLFAWKVVKHVKSNAIVLTNNGQTLGVGAGQMSRVESVRIALRKAGEKAHGAVLASDAFFPFRDSVDLLAQAGVRAIVQPGGSVRDAEVIEAARQANITMVFTGRRHFRH